MEWTGLPYFLEVARTGSLRAAADKLGGNHATVDRHLRALERAYGVRLFERSRKGLVLTHAGVTLLPLAEQAEQSVISARRQVQGLDREEAGTVRLSIPTPFAHLILPEALARFERIYPEIQLDISVTNRIEDITRSETDVSVRIAHEVDDDVVGRRVLKYRSGIYASASYLAERFDTAGKRGEGLQWVGWGDPVPLPDWVRDSPFPLAVLRYRVRSPSLIISLVRSGVGMSYLPCWVACFHPELRRVPGTELAPDRSVWVLLHTDLRRTTRVRLLVDHLVESLRSRKDLFVNGVLEQPLQPGPE